MSAQTCTPERMGVPGGVSAKYDDTETVLRARCSRCNEVMWYWGGIPETHEGRCYVRNPDDGEPAEIVVDRVAPEHAHNSDYCRKFGTRESCRQNRCMCMCHDLNRRCQVCDKKAVIVSMSLANEGKLYRCWDHRNRCAPDTRFVYIADPNFTVFGGHWDDHRIPKLPDVAC